MDERFLSNDYQDYRTDEQKIVTIYSNGNMSTLVGASTNIVCTMEVIYHKNLFLNFTINSLIEGYALLFSDPLWVAPLLEKRVPFKWRDPSIRGFTVYFRSVKCPSISSTVT